jgi:hypothetical protein
MCDKAGLTVEALAGAAVPTAEPPRASMPAIVATDSSLRLRLAERTDVSVIYQLPFQL